MKQRTLGKTGLSVSEVGLGCWQLGGDFGPMDEARARSIVESAVDAGINFFDTADIYGAGKSETYLGSALVSSGEKAVIATKYGRAADTYPDHYSLTGLRDSVRHSQDRLQRDCIDLLQLHCIPLDVMGRGEIFDWLRTLQQDKLIHHFGASVETIEEGMLCIEQEGLASLQVIFNIFRQKLLDELLPAAVDSGVGIIARLPLASGMLSGKFTQKTQFAPNDHRHYNRDGAVFSVGETFAGIPFDVGIELVQELETFVPKGYTTAQMAMRWILDQPAVSTIIPGATSAEQVQSNAKVSDLPSLDEDLHHALARFYKDKVAQHIRGVY